MDPEVAERFEEGIDSEYHDAAEELSNQDTLLTFLTGVVVVHHYVSV